MSFSRLALNFILVLLPAVTALAQESRETSEVAACFAQSTTRARTRPLSSKQVCALLGPKDLQADPEPILRQSKITAQWVRSRPRTAQTQAQTPSALWRELEEGKIQDLELAQELARFERLDYAEIALKADRKNQPLTPELLLSEGEKIRQNLRQVIVEHPRLSEASKKELSLTLDQVRILNFEAAAQITDPMERRVILTTLRDRCGPSTWDSARTEYLHRDSRHLRRVAKEVPALQLPPDHPIAGLNAVVICPRALSLVRSADIRLFPLLQWTLAHELGHAMTTLTGLDPAETQRNSSQAFRLSQASQLIHAPYLKCMQSEFGSAIPSLEELSFLALVTETNHPEQSGIITEIRDQVRATRENLAWTPLGVESHAKELVADYWAARWVARFGLPKETNLVQPFLSGAFARSCFMEQKTQTVEGIPNGEEGVHPANSIRMHVILSQPEVKRALRKAFIPLPDTPPSCGL